MFYLFFQKYLHFTSLFNVCYSKDSSRKLSQYRFLNSGRPKNFQPSSEVEGLSASGKKIVDIICYDYVHSSARGKDIVQRAIARLIPYPALMMYSGSYENMFYLKTVSRAPAVSPSLN